MKQLFTIITLMTSLSAFAQSLEECESKIAQLLSQVNTQELRVLALNADGTNPTDARVDTYHMSSNNLCGVELVKETGLLTVTKFKPLTGNVSDMPLRDIAKFESIVLNGSDPTRSNGRIKSKVHCSMTENSVLYTTKVPVLTDGIRSPWAIEELKVTLKDNSINFKLRATVSPIDKVFRSITDCNLTVD